MNTLLKLAATFICIAFFIGVVNVSERKSRSSGGVTAGFCTLLGIYCVYKIWTIESEPDKEEKVPIYSDKEVAILKKEITSLKTINQGFYMLIDPSKNTHGFLLFDNLITCRKASINDAYTDIQNNQKHRDAFLATITLPENVGKISIDHSRNEVCIVFGANTIDKQTYICKLKPNDGIAATISYIDKNGQFREMAAEYYFQSSQIKI